MYELATKALVVLQSWPVVNGFFIITISFLTIMAIKRGDKDRKSGTYSVDMPAYLMVHDIAKDIGDIREENEKRNANMSDIIRLLSDLNVGQKEVQRLLEDIRNTKELYSALHEARTPRREN